MRKQSAPSGAPVEHRGERCDPQVKSVLMLDPPYRPDTPEVYRQFWDFLAVGSSGVQDPADSAAHAKNIPDLRSPIRPAYRAESDYGMSDMDI